MEGINHPPRIAAHQTFSNNVLGYCTLISAARAVWKGD